MTVTYKELERQVNAELDECARVMGDPAASESDKQRARNYITTVQIILMAPKTPWVGANSCAAIPMICCDGQWRPLTAADILPYKPSA